MTERSFEVGYWWHREGFGLLGEIEPGPEDGSLVTISVVPRSSNMLGPILGVGVTLAASAAVIAGAPWPLVPFAMGIAIVGLKMQRASWAHAIGAAEAILKALENKDARQPQNNEMQLTRSATAVLRGPRS